MKVGDKVVCIYGGPWYDQGGDVSNGPHPIKDEIYTYDGECVLSPETGLYLKELHWIYAGYRASWEKTLFRPIVDIGDEVESYIAEKIKEEDLQHISV